MQVVQIGKTETPLELPHLPPGLLSFSGAPLYRASGATTGAPTAGLVLILLLFHA